MDFMSLMSFDTRSKEEINDPNVLFLEDCSKQIPELAGLYVYFDKMADTDGVNNVDCLEQFMQEYAQENSQLAARLPHLQRLVRRNPDAVMKFLRESMQKKSFGQILLEQYDGNLEQLLMDAGLAPSSSKGKLEDAPLDSGFDDSFVDDPVPENATAPAPSLAPEPVVPIPTKEPVTPVSAPEPISEPIAPTPVSEPIPEPIVPVPEPVAPAPVSEPVNTAKPVPKSAPLDQEPAHETNISSSKLLSSLTSDDDEEEEIPSMDRVIYDCVQSVTENTEATNKMIAVVQQIGKSLGITVPDSAESVDRELVFGSLQFLDKLSPEVIKSAFIHCVDNKSMQKEIDAMAKVIRLVYTYIRKHVK